MSKFEKEISLGTIVDPTLQKAFLPSINGCIQHNMVVDEIKDATQKKKRLTSHFLILKMHFEVYPAL